MEPRNPAYAEEIARLFRRAPFVRLLGVELIDAGPGWCETRLVVEERHLQHDGVIHAGVQATIADHSAGAAGATLISARQYVLTAEFRISLLRAARGTRLRCRATVLKPGSRLSFVESEVYSLEDGSELLAAKASVTLAVLDAAGSAPAWRPQQS